MGSLGNLKSTNVIDSSLGSIGNKDKLIPLTKKVSSDSAKAKKLLTVNPILCNKYGLNVNKSQANLCSTTSEKKPQNSLLKIFENYAEKDED